MKVGNGGSAGGGITIGFFRLLIADGMTKVSSSSGPSERSLLNSRSNSSVSEDFLGLLTGSDGREYKATERSGGGAGGTGGLEFFVFIVSINCRISHRSTEVKLDWLWLRETEDSLARRRLPSEERHRSNRRERDLT